MSSWTDGPLAVVDFETTAPIPTDARIVTACVVLADGLNLPGPTSRTWIARPDGFTVPDEAAAIHGWTTERLQAEGRPHREVIIEIADTLRFAWEAGRVLVGMHHSLYDVPLIQCELDRYGLPRLDVGPMVDILVIDRKVDRYRRTKADGGRTLGNLTKTYLPAHKQLTADEAHSADGDCIATLRVLWALVRKYPHLAAMSLEELHEFQTAAHLEWSSHMTDWLRKDQPDHEGIDTAWPLVPEPVPMAFSA